MHKLSQYITSLINVIILHHFHAGFSQCKNYEKLNELKQIYKRCRMLILYWQIRQQKRYTDVWNWFNVLKSTFWTHMEIHNGCLETAKALTSLPSNCLVTLTASILVLLIASHRSYYKRPGLDVRTSTCYLLTTLYGPTTTVLFDSFNVTLLDFIQTTYMKT